jgi:hypothetical protein
MDDFIMSQTYFQWFDKYSEKAQKALQNEQQNQMTQSVMGAPTGGGGGEGPPNDAAEPHVSNQLESQTPEDFNQTIEKEGGPEEVEKAIKIEYYSIKK